MPPQKKLIVLALGGNSLITDEDHQSVPDQYAACLETCHAIAPLLRDGYRMVITHGNGPQVGFVLRRSELAAGELHMVPLDSCGAETQGAIGYLIQHAMYNCTRDWPEPVRVATVITQTLVDADDPAFDRPTKPIGSFMDAQTAEERRAKEGWKIVEDAGRGFRRVVASPRPREILEFAAVRGLVDDGFVVVAAGGGGIPVVRRADGRICGADAVIDKDLAASLLAQKLRADLLVMSTPVENVCLNYDTPSEQPIHRMTIEQARRYIDEGHFAPGSMLPKIEAIVEFLENGGPEAVITDPPNLARAILGPDTGTRIVRG
jgi:carbamate kinase